MSKNKKLIPELRFPEFANEGEWDYKPIGEVFNSFSGGTPSTSEREYYGGKIPFIRSAEINKDETELFLTDDGLNNSSAKLVNKGDLLVALYGANSGDSAISKINGAINQAILCLQSDYSNTFTYNFLTLKKDWIVSRFIQGGQGNLSGDIVKSIIIPFPKKQEQQKIASCLSSLDKVISAHSQKSDLLKDHKKGLMQNLFPQQGEKVPKYRFPEFVNDGEWKVTKLGNCLIRPAEYGINAPAVPYSDKLPTYLRITDISEDGRFLSNGKVSVDREVTENNYLSEGDIVLARTGASVGKSYRYRNEDGRLVFAGFLIRVKTYEPELNSGFLFQFFATNQYWKWVSFISARSGQPGINGTEYSSMPISLPPTIKEQQEIAFCLSTLDELIAAQAENIEQLTLHKKGLMQGLFPKMND